VQQPNAENIMLPLPDWESPTLSIPKGRKDQPSREIEFEEIWGTVPIFFCSIMGLGPWQVLGRYEPVQY